MAKKTHSKEDWKTVTAPFLTRARQALEEGNPDGAQLHLGLGELMADKARGEYLLTAGQLWLEYGYVFPAYDRFLEAEFQTTDDDVQEEIQTALMNLEADVALSYAEKEKAPDAAFWTCLVANRTGQPFHFDFQTAWRVLKKLEALDRALQGVAVLGSAAYLEASTEKLQDVVAAVGQAPQCLAVLREFRRFVRSLQQWKKLDPVTAPWLQVLDAVISAQR